MVRRSFVVCLALVASCGRPSQPVRLAQAPSAMPPGDVAAPHVPWVPRKVIANAPQHVAADLTVAAGESWQHLVDRSGIPAGALAASNGLSLPVALKAGQSVKVPGGRVHIVAAGETGIAIARAYGVEWSRVVAANRLAPPYTLEIGDRLLLPSKQAVAAMSIEQRARAFRIDIDDLITGTEPAARSSMPGRVRAVAPASPPSSGKPKVAIASPTPPLPALPTGSPVFAWPVEGRILSSFGPKPGGRYNDGVNLKASAGSIVRAAADGVVAYAGDAVAGFGNLILIKHAEGWVTAYAHNEALLVERGARVRKGDPVARAGATGSVDEPQVHFELRHGRAAVDPAKVLPARG